MYIYIYMYMYIYIYIYIHIHTRTHERYARARRALERMLAIGLVLQTTRLLLPAVGIPVCTSIKYQICVECLSESRTT